MDSNQDLRFLASEILRLEATFGESGTPPDDQTAVKWLKLTSDFLVKHGVARRRRAHIRLPTHTTLRYRWKDEIREDRCTNVGHGGLTILCQRADVQQGTALLIVEAQHLGQAYHQTYPMALPARVHWLKPTEHGLLVGVIFEQARRPIWGSAFFAWYVAVYREYLRAVASGESPPAMGEPPPESRRAEEAPTDPLAVGASPPRMLIVDDEDENIRLIERAFHGRFAIHVARNGLEAVEVALKVEPHVVITDQRMPGKTGVEFLAKIREHLPATVRVLITAYADYEALVSAVNTAMIHHYFEKPVNIGDLKSVVESLCADSKT